jgi:glycosyltransferase involved in cell wall biosynthesis
MHIAYIHQHFATRQTATGTRSYEMGRALLAAGHRVSMITGVHSAASHVLKGDERVNKLDIDGIDVYAINEPYANKMSFWRRILAFQRFAAEAARVATSLKPDLVFATSTPLTVGIPGMRAARRLGCPFVFEVRDLWPELPISMGIIRNPVLKWYTRRMERNIYRAAERIIALSPGMKEGICKTGYPAERVTMIPNGCDLDLFKPDDAPLDDPRFGPPDDYRLVFTGAHGKANGLDAVLDAAAELLRRGERGIRFVFIGAGGERDRLIERSRNEGTDRFITWMEGIPKNDLAKVQPRLDAGMMILKNIPNFYYGTSPNKFFDYIAAGLPVLNNYPGWVADMLREWNCGIAVPPDDAGAFADACVWLRDHRREGEEMGRRGRKLAEEKFARESLGAQFVETLERAKARQP